MFFEDPHRLEGDLLADATADYLNALLSELTARWSKERSVRYINGNL